MEKSINQNRKWGPRSLTFWLTILCSIGLIGLGVNGFIQPQFASKAFGLEMIDQLDNGFVRVKANRDLFLGLCIAVFLYLKMKKTLSIIALISAIIPLIDGILVLTQHGGQLKDSWQHFITMVFVLFVAFLLRRERRNGLWE